VPESCAALASLRAAVASASAFDSKDGAGTAGPTPLPLPLRRLLVSDCAEKGSISPGRFGCCHGKDQVRAMIANLINRAFGRVSLRGAARVRHAALIAATGSKQYTSGHSTSAGMRGAEDAWDSTGDQAQGGCGAVLGWLAADLGC